MKYLKNLTIACSCSLKKAVQLFKSCVDFLFPKYSTRRKMVKHHIIKPFLEIIAFLGLRTPQDRDKKLISSDSKILNILDCLNWIFSPQEKRSGIPTVTFSTLCDAFHYSHIEFTFHTRSRYREKLLFHASKSPFISIIVYAHNHLPYLLNCLDALHRHTHDLSYEIILVLDGTEGYKEALNDYVEGVQIIKNDNDMGLFASYNKASPTAKGLYLVLLHQALEVQENWGQPLLSLIKKDDRTGIAGMKILSSRHNLNGAGGVIRNNGHIFEYGKDKNPELSEYNYVKEVDTLTSPYFLVNKTLWERLGGFDESFDKELYAAADLSMTARALEYKVMYQPGSSIIQFELPTPHKNDNTNDKSADCQRFLEKWRMTLENGYFYTGEKDFKARDRSVCKKTLLVIDHYVPTFDRDAGSKCTIDYLKLFVEMGFNVKFLGENCMRPEPYTSILQQMGIEVLYGRRFDYDGWKRWLRESMPLDYVYLNRPHIALKYISYLRKHTSAKILYFGQDLHFLREQRRYELEGDREIGKKAAMTKAMEFKVFQDSDVIYYPSNVEVDILRSQLPGKVVRAIPLYIMEDNQEVKALSSREKEGLLFVGSFGHPPNGDAVTWFITSILPPVIERYPEITLYVVGSDTPESFKQFASMNVKILGYLETEQLKELYRNVRIAVVPLRYGAGVKGKILEAMHFHTPVITTSIGAEGLPEVQDILVIADDAISFAEKLISLYSDFDYLDSLQEKSSAYLKAYFSKEYARTIISADLVP